MNILSSLLLQYGDTAKGRETDLEYTSIIQSMDTKFIHFKLNVTLGRCNSAFPAVLLGVQQASLLVELHY